MNNIDGLECPGCRRVPDVLVLHHWIHKEGNTITQDVSLAIETGKYRYICDRCNSTLGRIFKGSYPDSWEDQLSALKDYRSPTKDTEGLIYITKLSGMVFASRTSSQLEARKNTVKLYLKLTGSADLVDPLLQKCQAVSIKTLRGTIQLFNS